MTQPKKQLTPEQLKRVAKISEWMKTLNHQQVADVMRATDKPVTHKAPHQPKA
ncbi:hypothetical protein [Levilactobacillus namurensis]|uniref:Uncharacterized protein n=1 Tax=Levilactobacillus namurensis TaxID=380393 RepID=A0AAW8W360_9LACO|nr:hypothetical protein [Levilactobacillus namurensis]MCW3779009.1 hypothetical protein [Levilactobacillus namurensis]MDT7012889.1 hypothetical protein [Levilactobacillus namurensis]MDT7017875.1 hypothetical protein [Levilactobacillus namurensis]WNN65125.1 hypothetical protein RIN67_10605 [Levilactobacillus namurensis]